MPRLRCALTSSLILLLLAAILPAESSAAEADHSLSVSASGAAVGLRETTLNPVVYEGLVPELRLSWASQTDRHLQRAWLSGGLGTLTNRYELPVTHVPVDFGWGLERQVWRGDGGRLRIWLGAEAAGRWLVSNFELEDSDHVYWATAYGLGPVARLAWSLGPSTSLVAAAHLPLIALVSRTPGSITYNNDEPGVGYLLAKIHEAPVVASPLDHLDLHVPIALVHRGEAMIHSIGYELGYTRIGTERLTERLGHTVRLSIGWRL